MAYLHDKCYYDELSTMVESAVQQGQHFVALRADEMDLPSNLSILARERGCVRSDIGWELRTLDFKVSNHVHAFATYFTYLAFEVIL